MTKRPYQRGDEIPSPDRAVESADRVREPFRSADIVLVEVAKLQTDGDHLKSAMSEMKKDIRELRDRVIVLEVNVSHLPSKGFIVAVVIAALTLIGGLLTIAPQLQRLAGTSQVTPVTTNRP